jgi:hypothetical protein
MCQWLMILLMTLICCPVMCAQVLKKIQQKIQKLNIQYHQVKRTGTTRGLRLIQVSASRVDQAWELLHQKSQTDQPGMDASGSAQSLLVLPHQPSSDICAVAIGGSDMAVPGTPCVATRREQNLNSATTVARSSVETENQWLWDLLWRIHA